MTWYLGLPDWLPNAIGVVVAAAVIGELIGWGVRSLMARAGARPPTVRAARETLRAAWILIAVFGVLSAAKVTSALTVLTVSGILGLVVSLALQTTLSNMVSGLMLLRNEVLRLGDLVEYGSVRGRVVRIGLVNTWIRTEEGELAFVGNTSLLGGPFVNRTAGRRLPEYVAQSAGAPPPSDKVGSTPSASKATESAPTRTS